MVGFKCDFVRSTKMPQKRRELVGYECRKDANSTWMSVKKMSGAHRWHINVKRGWHTHRCQKDDWSTRKTCIHVKRFSGAQYYTIVKRISGAHGYTHVSKEWVEIVDVIKEVKRISGAYEWLARQKDEWSTSMTQVWKRLVEYTESIAGNIYVKYKWWGGCQMRKWSTRVTKVSKEWVKHTEGIAGNIYVKHKWRKVSKEGMEHADDKSVKRMSETRTWHKCQNNERHRMTQKSKRFSGVHGWHSCLWLERID